MKKKVKNNKIFVVVFVPIKANSEETYLISNKAYKTLEEAREYINNRSEDIVEMPDSNGKAYHSEEYFYGINELELSE